MSKELKKTILSTIGITTISLIVAFLSGCTAQTSGGALEFSARIELPNTNSQLHKSQDVHTTARNDFLKEKYPNAYAILNK